MFCCLLEALSHAYSRDITPVGYGGARREIWNRITRIQPFIAPTLKDRRTTRGGEIRRKYLPTSTATQQGKRGNHPFVALVLTRVPGGALGETDRAESGMINLLLIPLIRLRHLEAAKK